MLYRLLTGCSHPSVHLTSLRGALTVLLYLDEHFSGDLIQGGLVSVLLQLDLITSTCFHTDSLLERMVRSCIRIYSISQIAQSDGSHEKADQEHICSDGME